MEPLLLFHYDDLNYIRKNFLFNNLGDRIYNFCQNQDCITYAAVAVTERELEKNRLDKFSFIYNKRDECKHFLLATKQDN
ncbi:DUF5838 family protein [Coleofasciculus sp. E1-EBD-02]|uniref:DUF5838 family protein n=1 Tax=Coleofasciculus sp. E1-EBD-02 TaxID=3068481 RepID=UPI0040644AB9